jgi:hypothetical protein
LEQEFQDIPQQSWQCSSAWNFSHKTYFLATDLKKWRKEKQRNCVLIAQIEFQILQQQSLHPSLQNHSLQQQLHDKRHSLMAKEETFYIQRTKKRWVVKGDRNTIFSQSYY